MSNFTIAVGATIRYFGFSIHQKHPKRDSTIVDYGLAGIMAPLMMLGSFVSVIFAQIMPDAVLTIIISVLMVYLSVDTSTKAVKMWRQETQISLQQLQDNLSNSIESSFLSGFTIRDP